MVCQLTVLVHTPAYSSLGSVLTYQHDTALPAGTLVQVPLGKRQTTGIVWRAPASADQEIDPSRIKPITAVLTGIAPLGQDWMQLVEFAAQYYQRSPGEFALGSLPSMLRTSTSEQWSKRLARYAKTAKPARSEPSPAPSEAALRPLTEEQSQALHTIATQAGPFLLFGATGSGKTEVYLRCMHDVLQADPVAQVLLMVPEINLTPQLMARVQERFAPVVGAQAIVSMHSALTPAQRLQSWLAAHSGHARIIVGTRMAVLASLPSLRLIIVDEEHDPSYKSADGARHSARDLAIYRGHQLGAKVILGSATPSLESWHHSRPAVEGGRYTRLHMPQRVGQASAPPPVRCVDMNRYKRHTLIAPPLLQAIRDRVSRNEQSLLLLNRRGYAPVLFCPECGWKSACPHCSAYKVLHKADHMLRCHHCGHTQRVPKGCPDCQHPDILPIGHGTEQIEEILSELLADCVRPDGAPARLARLDADTTQHKNSLETQLQAVHDGTVDVLIGTQMIAKGHDFRRVTLVAALNPDTALYASDFRAPERLFALLMQTAGRAGRDAALSGRSEVLLQTTLPGHPLYQALSAYDYSGFAAQQLQERAQAGMPPFMAQALIRAEARSQEAAQAFLHAARHYALHTMRHWPDWSECLDRIHIYPAVPMSLQKLAGTERAQMVIESPSRTALQQFLNHWQPALHALKGEPTHKPVQRWAIDVDPQSI